MATSPPGTRTNIEPVNVPLGPDPVPRITDLTQQVFQTPVTVKASRDPEYPYDEFTVFGVEVSGDADQLVELECEWIAKVSAVVPGLGMFRLAMHLK